MTMKPDTTPSTGAEQDDTDPWGWTHQISSQKTFFEWLLRLRGHEIDEYRVPEPQSPEARAHEDRDEVVRQVKGYMADGTIDEGLALFRYKKIGLLMQDLYFHPQNEEDILLSVHVPLLRDYSVVKFPDDEHDPTLVKQVPVGVSTEDWQFLGLSLSEPEDPHSLMLIGRGALRHNFLASIGEAADLIDTLPDGRHPKRFKQYLVANPSTETALYGLFRKFPTYSREVSQSHPHSSKDLYERTCQALNALGDELAKEPYDMWANQTHHFIYLQDFSLAQNAVSGPVADSIVRWLKQPDPRIHIFGTMGHTQETLNLLLGQTPASFDETVYGAAPTSFRFPRQGSDFNKLLYDLPPHQFALADGQTYWVPKP